MPFAPLGFLSNKTPSAAPAKVFNFAQATPDAFSPMSFSRGSAGTYFDGAGKMQSAASGVARFEYFGPTPVGLKKEKYCANYCTNYNMNPTDTSGVTTGGDSNAILSVALDTDNLLKSVINEYGYISDLSVIANIGKIYKLDNTTGTNPAYMEVSSGTFVYSNGNAAISAYVKVTGGVGQLNWGSVGTPTNVPAQTNLQRLSVVAGIPVANFNGSITGNTLTVNSLTYNNLQVGHFLNGTNITSGTTVTGFGTSTGNATGTFTFTNNPSDGKIIFVNGVTWTFVSSLTSGASLSLIAQGQLQGASVANNKTVIKSTLAATLTQLASDLNASSNAQIQLATYAATATTIVVTADAAGAVGTLFSMGADSSATATVTAGRLTGGTDTWIVNNSQTVASESMFGDFARGVRLTVPAGAVGYMIGNQIEVSSFMTSLIVTAGSSNSRQADLLSDTGLATRAWFNQNQGAFMAEFDFDDVYNDNTYLVSISNGTGTTDAMGTTAVGGRAKLKAGTSQNGTKVTLTQTTNAGNSGTDIHAMDSLHESFHCGMTWNLTKGTYNSIAGGMEVMPHKFNGTYANPLNRIDIGGRPFAQYICGHVRKVQFWNVEPTIPQIGRFMNFNNSVGITCQGQSLFASSWNAEGNQYYDAGTSDNAGERALIAELKKYYPTKRCYIIKQSSSGSTISFGNAAGTSGNAWYDYADGVLNPLMYRSIDMLNGYLNGGGEVIGHIINGHESDTSQSTVGLLASHNVVQNKIWCNPVKRGSNVTIKQVPTIFQPFNKRTDGNTGNNSSYQKVREMQRTFASLNPNVTLGIGREKQQMEFNGVHMTNAGNAAQQPLDVRLLAGILGFSVTGAWQQITIRNIQRTGTTIVINLNLPAGITDFTPTTNIQGFYFFDNAAVPATDTSPTNPIAITSAVRTGPSQITLTLASTPTNAGVLYYGYGIWYIGSTPVDPKQVIQGNDANGLPLAMFTTALPYGSITPSYELLEAGTGKLVLEDGTGYELLEQ